MQDIPLKRALWNTTRCLTLFFVDNHGRGEEETTRLSFLGFKGEWMPLSREPVNVLYEAAPNPSDHKVVGTTGLNVGGGIGGGEAGEGL